MKNSAEKTTDQKLKEIILLEEKKNTQNAQYKSLKKADELYNKMLAEGLIEKRGYTLMGVEDTHLLHVRVNSLGL